MFFKNFQLLFLIFLISGTIISVSANSWFTSWVGLEINLMSMIPLMLNNLSFKASESAVKYFLVQALGSVFLIFFSSLTSMNSSYLSIEAMELFIILSLVLKAGLAPLHFWFPQVSNNLNWIQCFIIFSWQKVAPLILISALNFKIILLISIMSALIGALGGFNQLLMKIILSYSSIAHSSWMILACFLNFNSWMIYFFIYCILSASIISFFFSHQIKKLNQIFLSGSSVFDKLNVILNIFSLGGLPPLLGFLSKMIIIMVTLNSTVTIIIPVLIMSSLISLYFYTRVIYSSMMMSSKTPKINFFNKKMTFTFFSITIFLNSISPFMLILI